MKEPPFSSTLGDVSTSFGIAGQRVTITRSGPVFSSDGARNVVTLQFAPVGGPTTEVAVAAESPADGEACAPRHCERRACSCTSFVFPDTDAAVGDPGDGRGLTGSVRIRVTTDGTTTALVDTLYFPGTRLAHDVATSFLALPPTNPFGSLGAAEPRALLAASDGSDLFVPLDFRAVISEVPFVTRFLDVTAPGFGGVTSERFQSFTVEGRRLPPLLSRAPESDTLIGSIDAPESVVRVQGVGALPAVDGKGPIVIADVVGISDPRTRADIRTLQSIGDWAVYENPECPFERASDCLDLNGDGDTSDAHLFALPLADPVAEPILIDSIDTRDVPSYSPVYGLAYDFVLTESLLAYEVFDLLAASPTVGSFLRTGLYDLERRVAVFEGNDVFSLAVDGRMAAFGRTLIPEPAPVLHVYDAGDAVPAIRVVSGDLPHYFLPSPDPTAPALERPGLAVAGGRVVFAANESAHAQDLDGNGQTIVAPGESDFALFLLEGGDVVNLHRSSPSADPSMSRRWLTFTSEGGATGKVDLVDLDGARDRVQTICDPGRASFVFGAVSDRIIPCAQLETDVDLTGDSDLRDAVLRFRTDTVETPVTTDVSVADLSVLGTIATPIVRDGVLVIAADERESGKDLNGDDEIDGGPLAAVGLPSGVLAVASTARSPAAGGASLINSGLSGFTLEGALSLQFIRGGVSFIGPRDDSTFDAPKFQRVLLRDLDGDGSFEERFLGLGGALHDNCPLSANPDQADADGDGIGDACESSLRPFCSPGAGDNGSGVCCERAGGMVVARPLRNGAFRLSGKLDVPPVAARREPLHVSLLARGDDRAALLLRARQRSRRSTAFRAGPRRARIMRRRDGTASLVIGGKGWFRSTSLAGEPSLRIDVGTQCIEVPLVVRGR